VYSEAFSATKNSPLSLDLHSPPYEPTLVITSYGVVNSKTDHFRHKSRSWDYVVLDEAHLIKNPAANRSKCCKKICSETTFRLMLTGTPVLNRLEVGDSLSKWTPYIEKPPANPSSFFSLPI